MTFRNLLCIALSIFVLQKSGLFAVTGTGLHPPESLKINGLTQSYGIPADSPTFSWIMDDDNANQLQTAYEVVIASSLAYINEDKYDIADTGKVNSPESACVKISNLKLADNSLYYWKVRIWDSSGNESEFSSPSAFTTAVGSGWNSTNAIWASDAPGASYSDWSNYTVELDMKITNAASGLKLRDTGGTDYYLWNFSVKSNAIILTHCKNGKSSALGSAILLSKYNQKISQRTYFHVKIVLNGGNAETYINGILVDKRAVSGCERGTFGFLNPSGEIAYFKNIRVYKADAAGAVSRYLYSDQFAYGSNPFCGGLLTDGQLRLVSTQSLTFSTADPLKSWTNYALSFDLTVTAGTPGVRFRVCDGGLSYYNWQFDAAHNQLIPNIWVGGKCTQLPAVPLSKCGVSLKANAVYGIRIVAAGNKISTYIGTTLVNTTTSDELSSGSFGFLTGAKDSASVQNVQAYLVDASGQKLKYLYSDLFASGANSFTGGTVSGSALKLGANINVQVLDVPVTKNYIFLRNQFNISNLSSIDKAIVSVTATSPEKTKQYTYSLFLNGNSVGVGPCVSSGTEIRYNTYDVTQYLKSGANAIGTIDYALSGKQFLLQMTVYNKDGTSAVLLNSGRDAKSWRSLDGTAIFGENETNGTAYYSQAAENINATLFPFGWDSAGFNDSNWQSATAQAAIPSVTLVPVDESNVQLYTGNATRVFYKGNGNYFIDLGKEVVGGISLTLTSSTAARITIRYGEEKDGGNSVNYQMKTGNCYQEIWTLKQGSQTITNYGLKNFRYIEILNCPVTLTVGNIHSISVRQTFDDDDADFTSSDTSLNNIYALCKYTIKESNQTLQVDSQARERNAYQGDSLINSLASFAVDSDSTLSKYSTEYLNAKASWPAEYKLMSVMLTWDYYLYTGDFDIVQDSYDTLKKTRLYDNLFDTKYNLVKRANSGLSDTPDSILVDWPAAEQDGYDRKDAEYNTVLNAVAYAAYLDMSNMAAMLGNTDDAADYSGKASKIQQAMMTKLYNSKLGAFSDGLTADGKRIEHYAQHASAFSLSCGIVTDSAVKQAVAGYIGKSGKFKTSVYGALFVLSSLYEANAGGTALQLLTSNDVRSWNHMLALGATMTAEAWDPCIKTNMTYSHPWGTAPLSQIVSGMFGIQPITAGFSTFQIKFQPGSLNSASLKLPTVKGTVSAAFDTATGFSATVTIPGNTVASVYIPIPADLPDTLTVDGVSTTAVRSDGYLEIGLGSGTHTVTVIYQKPNITNAMIPYKKREWWE